MEYSESELICKIYRVQDEHGFYNPAIEVVKSHDMDPTWVGGLMYLIFDRYLSNVEDSKQHIFAKEVFKWLSLMKKDGGEYVDKILPPSDY